MTKKIHFFHLWIFLITTRPWGALNCRYRVGAGKTSKFLGSLWDAPGHLNFQLFSSLKFLEYFKLAQASTDRTTEKTFLTATRLERSDRPEGIFSGEEGPKLEKDK